VCTLFKAKMTNGTP